MWYIVGWSQSGLSASLLSSRIFCGLLLCSRKIFAFRRFKAGNVWSLWPVLCSTSYICIRMNDSPSHSGPFGARLVHVGIVVVFFLQRRSHHIVRLGKCPFCRCSCPNRVLNISVHAFSVITALSIFHSPRPLRVIGRSIDISRHTAR